MRLSGIAAMNCADFRTDSGRWFPVGLSGMSGITAFVRMKAEETGGALVLIGHWKSRKAAFLPDDEFRMHNWCLSINSFATSRDPLNGSWVA